MFATSILMLTALVAQDKPAAKAPAEHPYAKAKVGDFVIYKSGDAANPVIMKHSVISKTDAEVTLKVEQKIGGNDTPPMDHKIDLTKPIDPEKAAEAAGVKMETTKLGSGKETLTIDGKKLDCDWVKNKIVTTQKVGDMEIKTELTSKVWTCKDVPLGGTVRTETEYQGGKSVMELTNYGAGK